MVAPPATVLSRTWPFAIKSDSSYSSATLSHGSTRAPRHPGRGGRCRNQSAAAVLDATPTAASFFVDPTGAPFGEERSEEGIAYAEIDLARCVEPKRFHDVVAGYNRFLVFELTTRRTRHAPVRFKDTSAGAATPETREPVLLRLAAEG